MEYKCSYCDEHFQTEPDLEEHKTSLHSGDNPYFCKLCENRFTRKDSLQGHIKKTHREKIYQCTICDARYSIREALRDHMRYDAKNGKFI